MINVYGVNSISWIKAETNFAYAIRDKYPVAKFINLRVWIESWSLSFYTFEWHSYGYKAGFNPALCIINETAKPIQVTWFQRQTVE